MAPKFYTIMANIWDFYRTFSTIGLTSLIITFAVVKGFSDEGPVMKIDGPATLITKEVPYKGNLIYRFSVHRLISCPGTVINSFANITYQTAGDSSVVTIQRPANRIEPKHYPNTLAEVKLPESVYPGKWRMTSSVYSRCPTFERTDTLATVEFEVTP